MSPPTNSPPDLKPALPLSAPQPLAASHLLAGFGCGEASLDDWLKRRALANQLSGASRTFVVADGQGRVFGYYAMAAGAVAHQLATSGVRRNMPDPIPVMVLARLAVDQRAQGIQARGRIAARCRASGCGGFTQRRGPGSCSSMRIDEHAKQFYEHYGFQESPQHPMTLMLRLNSMKA
jgi:hypothetical protein